MICPVRLRRPVFFFLFLQTALSAAHFLEVLPKVNSRSRTLGLMVGEKWLQGLWRRDSAFGIISQLQVLIDSFTECTTVWSPWQGCALRVLYCHGHCKFSFFPVFTSSLKTCFKILHALAIQNCRKLVKENLALSYAVMVFQFTHRGKPENSINPKRTQAIQELPCNLWSVEFYGEAQRLQFTCLAFFFNMEVMLLMSERFAYRN